MNTKRALGPGPYSLSGRAQAVAESLARPFCNVGRFHEGVLALIIFKGLQLRAYGLGLRFWIGFIGLPRGASVWTLDLSVQILKWSF